MSASWLAGGSHTEAQPCSSPPPTPPGVYFPPMPPFSLLSPLPGLPWYLLPIWPLIFWRIQRLKAWFRENGGPGSQMLWGVMKNGRVILIRASDDLTGHRPCTFRAPVSDRLRLALSPEAKTPYSRPMPQPFSMSRALAARDPGIRLGYRLMGLVIPDT